MNISFKKYQQGVGLIEVLVAILLLSTSLMALAAMQMRSLQYNKTSYFESQANILVTDIIDRMRVNSANNAAYNVAMGPVTGTAVNPTVLPNAAADIDQWRRLIAANLPNGQGAISCVGAPITCTITIQWDNLNNATGAGQGTVDDKENRFTLTYSARI